MSISEVVTVVEILSWEILVWVGISVTFRETFGVV